MENKRIKVRLNSVEKIEEVLQEVYDQACRQINEVQNEINKLINSTNLASDDFTMEDKAKYFKAIHDLTGDKKSDFHESPVPVISHPVFSTLL